MVQQRTGSWFQSCAAAKNLGEPQVSPRVRRELWNKAIPGMLKPVDCASRVRRFAGRPLLLPKGDRDRTARWNARIAFAVAEESYRTPGTSDKRRIMVTQVTGTKHNRTTTGGAGLAE